MLKKHRVFGFAGFLAVLAGFIGKSVYRDYINLHAINDFGIAGFLPSYFYVIGFSLLLLIRPTKFPKIIILIVSLGSVIYEMKQYIDSGNLDFMDITASLAGGISALIILIIIETKAYYYEKSN